MLYALLFSVHQELTFGAEVAGGEDGEVDEGGEEEGVVEGVDDDGIFLRRLAAIWSGDRMDRKMCFSKLL